MQNNITCRDRQAKVNIFRLAPGGSLVRLSLLLLLAAMLSFSPHATSANVAGGGTGAGPNVTVKDNGDGTVTLANGIASIVIVKKGARLNSATYTYNNGSGPVTTPMLGNGQYYYGGFMLGNGTFTYSLAADPATNGGNYADVELTSISDAYGVMEAHFSMLRGSPGFYSTAVLTHRPQDGKANVGAWGVVMRVPPYFNWLSADPTHDFMIGERTTIGRGVPNSPHEISVSLDGTRQGNYDDKFIYGQDHADLRAWGWSSVGAGRANVGMWITTNMEFSDGGPMKRDVSAYPYSEMNNSILTGELGMGSDGDFAPGETWTKTCGPWFVYMNHAPASMTDARQTAHTLYNDALAQSTAESEAWPYKWFKNPNYVSASGRGAVTGRFVIHDSGNPRASAAGLWVGVEQQPPTNRGAYDFQKWLKPYQFWTQTDSEGNFRIPNVIAGRNYTLWAYGPGAAGTFQSQRLTGGDPPLELDLPAKPFKVDVTGGGTTPLGTVTWTPVRVGATVFELGYPDRKADKYRHGDDYWAPGPPPKLGFPTPEWGGQMLYPLDFPDGLHYTVGKSHWATDWNYILPSLPNLAEVYQPAQGTITFDLAHPPAAGARASLYLGCAGDDSGKIKISINGTALDAAPGVTAAPNPLTDTGFDPPYFDDSSIHFSDHGPFSDERINFPGPLLHAGKNTVTILMGATRLTAYLMVDYLRLELTGYVPPAPGFVAAYAGNRRVQVCWPAVPGATAYNVLRSSTPNGKGVAIASDIVGPVSGADQDRTTYTDKAAANGATYYYSVQSVNPNGRSADSPPSAAATPSVRHSSEPPPAPTGLRVVRSGHHEVALSWSPSPGANYYSVWRTTLYPDRVGGYISLRTIVLEDATHDTSFTDTTTTDGRTYGYSVVATSAAGSSAHSAAVTAVPLPAPPTSAPASLAGTSKRGRNGTLITISWEPVPGATGYVIYRTTDSNGKFSWPTNFLAAQYGTVYTDADKKNSKLVPQQTYYYQVTAVNPGGISPPSSTVSVVAR